MVDALMAPTPRLASKPTLLHFRNPIDICLGPWHYVLLEITPRSSTSSSSAPVDAVTLHQMMLQTRADWYGSVGGSTTIFDVLALRAASTEAGPEKAKGDDVQLGLLRVETCSVYLHSNNLAKGASFTDLRSSRVENPSSSQLGASSNHLGFIRVLEEIIVGYRSTIIPSSRARSFGEFFRDREASAEEATKDAVEKGVKATSLELGLGRMG